VPFTVLPQLHTLKLSSLSLSTAQLNSLLRACPAVEQLGLHNLLTFTPGLLPAIRRSLSFEAARLDLLQEECVLRPVQAQLSEAEHAAGSEDAVIPQLVALTLEMSERAAPFLPADPQAHQPADPPAVQRLPRLLQSTPVLRFVKLGLELCDSELLTLSSLSTLCGLLLLGLGKDWQQRASSVARRASSAFVVLGLGCLAAAARGGQGAAAGVRLSRPGRPVLTGCRGLRRQDRQRGLLRCSRGAPRAPLDDVKEEDKKCE
jgi:hypothetical protein